MHAKIEYTGAWMPSDARFDEDAGRRLATWVMDNDWGRDHDGHIIITPTMSNSISEPPILAALADGVPWVSPRADHEARGIPVVAAWPTEETLAYCVRRAHNTSLVVFEWGIVPSVHGWAAAVGAFNAETGEATPKLEPALHDVFVMLLFDDDYLREGPKKGKHRELTQNRLSQLHAAGLNQDFVVTYCIALGYRGDVKLLREHCNEAGIVKKWNL
jgi:hypothetical protein